MAPLLFASFIPDLLSLSPVLRLFATLFGIFAILFSILDFNVLLYHQQSTRSLLKWTNDRNDGIALWRCILMTLSGVASFTGALSVVLAAKGKYSNYLWGIVNCITYGAFAMAYGYAGDAQLNIIFFLPMQFVGLYLWRRNLDEENVAKSRSLGFFGWIIVLLSSFGIAIAFYFEIPAFATALAGSYLFEGLTIPRRLDSATNALSICAQILMLWRYWEQWLLWISVDVLQMIMYSGAVGGVELDINVLLMFVLFLCNAFYGCYRWFIRARRSKLKTATDSESNSPEAVDSDTKGFPERGFVVGKFWPPHKGHLHLLDTASRGCGSLFIIICERKDRVETPTGLQRLSFLQSTYPTATVKLIEDKHDQEDSKLWAELCREWLGFTPDIVFTSESYGTEFSAFLGCRHVCVDLPRKNFPISASRIRQDPYSNWQYLTSLSKSVYALRIIILGAESTGKTTLAQRLAGHFETLWVPELGREVAEEKMKNGAYVWASQDFVDIAAGQAKNEDEMAGECNKILICDTDAFATGVWHERYMEFRSSEVEEIARKRPIPTIYLIPEVAGKKFVAEAIRDGEHLREWMFELFIERLTEDHRPYVVLKGDYDEMYRQAVDEILQRFSSRSDEK
jgi:HTH-type transcriptional regulator, transcriptional repressor of NAD biosynthesis genes